MQTSAYNIDALLDKGLMKNIRIFKDYCTPE